MNKKDYNIVRKNQADLHALLRAAVCAYLLYLAYQIAFTIEDVSFPAAARVAAGVLFAVCAIVFGAYTWKRYQRDRRDALLTDEEKAELARDGLDGEDGREGQ